nr:NAD-dependent epimerase/dehydratase family protein [Pedobacter sp. ASV19]
MQLRNLEKNTLKNMALTGKIFKEKKDILYIRGEIKGKMETALEIAKELKKEGLSNEFIAKTTKLSVQEIEAL